MGLYQNKLFVRAGPQLNHLPIMATKFTLALQRLGNARHIARQLNKPAFFRPSLVASVQKRYASEVTEDLLKEEEAKQSWFDWLFPSKPEKVVTEQEKQERAELLERIQAVYYAKPPSEPGKEFFEESFHLLMKYDDWRSVEAVWRMSEAQKIEFDDDLLDKIEDFMLEWRERKWFE